MAKLPRCKQVKRKNFFERLDENLVFYMLVEFVDCRSLVFLSETCTFFYDLINKENGVSNELLHRISPLLFNKPLHKPLRRYSFSPNPYQSIWKTFNPKFKRELSLEKLHMENRTEKLHAINFYEEIQRAKRKFLASCGSEHTLAVSGDNELFTFGKNSDGQLGNGTKVDSHIPIRISLPKVSKKVLIQSVVGGENFSIVLLENGEVFGFGDNSCGQLGPYVKRTQITKPVNLKLPKVKISMISCAKDYTAIVLDDKLGTVLILGDGLPCNTQEFELDKKLNKLVRGEISSQDKVTEASAGFGHLLLITSQFYGFAVGNNSNGQLGLKTTFNNIDTTISVKPRLINFDFRKKPVAQVAAGEKHSLLLTQDGEVFSFGCSSSGQLGLGTFDVKVETASKVLLPEDSFPVIITCGNKHSVILDINGRVLTCGSNESGQTASLSPFFSNNRFEFVTSGYFSDDESFRQLTDIAAGKNFTAVIGNGLHRNNKENELIMFGNGFNCSVTVKTGKHIATSDEVLLKVKPMKVILEELSESDKEDEKEEKKVYYSSQYVQIRRASLFDHQML